MTNKWSHVHEFYFESSHCNNCGRVSCYHLFCHPCIQAIDFDVQLSAINGKIGDDHIENTHEIPFLSETFPYNDEDDDEDGDEDNNAEVIDDKDNDDEDIDDEDNDDEDSDDDDKLEIGKT